MFGHGLVSNFETLREDIFFTRDTGTPGDVTHGFKLNAVYELPFGQGHRLGGNANAVVDRIVNGWQVGFLTRIQSGRLVDLGNVKLVGMSKDDLQKAFKLRFDDAGKHVYMFPQDVIDNTIAAFNTSPTSPTGYAGTPPTGRPMAHACIMTGL